MPLNIKLENFEGPFDLLLHLIKKNQMDIYNVKIHEITTQYIDYLNEMRVMDLEVTSEFVVIAATLLEIKSKLLLPKPKQEETDENNEIDPQKELINKLIEYKKFKALALYLKEKEGQTGTYFTKKPEIIEDKHTTNNFQEIFNNITILDLFNIYNQLLDMYNSKLNTENVIQKKIPVDTYKIEDKMYFISEKLKIAKRIFFSELVGKENAKLEVVVTFLALLELTKDKEIRVLQESNFKDIIIERANING